MFHPVHGWCFGDVAAAYAELKNISRIVNIFQLAKHPAIVEESTERAARTGQLHATAVSHRLLRDVFYHADSYSLYDVRGDIAKVIQQQNKK